jgi:hypothetical protein
VSTGSRLVLAAATVLSIAACTPQGPTVSEGPTATQVAGRFDGVARGDAGCAWIDTDAGDRVELLYPNGWRVEFDPLAAFDETGARRIEAGQSVVVDGYYGESGASLCETDGSFVVTDVTGVQDR